MWGYVQTHCVLVKAYNVEERGDNKKGGRRGGQETNQTYFMLRNEVFIV